MNRVTSQSVAPESPAASPSDPAPLDARLARTLVPLLVRFRITPNALTTLRVLLGLAAAAALAMGPPGWATAGAWLFVLSNFVDHVDGELARLSGQSSRWGHYYDLACDVLVHVLLFVALGYGLRAASPGAWSVIIGTVAGLAVALTFWLHLRMKRALDARRARLPATHAFEIEDILYLFPLVTIFDIRLAFLTVSAVGASVFAAWLTLRFRRMRGANRAPRG